MPLSIYIFRALRHFRCCFVFRSMYHRCVNCSNLRHTLFYGLESIFCRNCVLRFILIEFLIARMHSEFRVEFLQQAANTHRNRVHILFFLLVFLFQPLSFFFHIYIFDWIIPWRILKMPLCNICVHEILRWDYRNAFTKKENIERIRVLIFNIFQSNNRFRLNHAKYVLSTWKIIPWSDVHKYFSSIYWKQRSTIDAIYSVLQQGVYIHHFILFIQQQCVHLHAIVRR